MDTFEWFPTTSAFKAFPMTLIDGNFIFSNNSALYLPAKRIIDNGWGQVGAIHLVGNRRKEIPVRLTLTWFSYFENKFFSGEFDINHEKIHAMFQNGFELPLKNEHHSYRHLVVGLGPKGSVVLWLEGYGRTLEVGCFSASEANLEWSLVLDNTNIERKVVIDEILEEGATDSSIVFQRKKGLASSLVQKYRALFPWVIEVVGTSVGHLWMESFNGERDFVVLSEQKSNVVTQRVLPKKLSLFWQNKKDKIIIAEVSFDEVEIYSAFKKLTELGSSEMTNNFKLLVETDPFTDNVVVLLHDGKYIIQLENITVNTEKI